jgi:imidazolonepropionase-like amidohydrolase
VIADAGRRKEMKIIQADRVVVGDGSSHENAAVAIEGETIAFAGDLREAVKRYPAAVVDRKPACTLLPGLVDMHVHIGNYARRSDAKEIEGNLGHITLIALKNLQDALSVGITTIRAVMEPMGLGSALRAGFRKGLIKGPRYITCERAIGITGGHGWESGDSYIAADGPWEVRKAVRQCLKEGAEWIKAMASHRTHHAQYTQEEMDAIVDEVHKFGKKCCVHAATIPAASMAIKAGFDSIEHGAFITPELAKQAAGKGIAWVPTAFVYMRAAAYLEEALAKSGEVPSKAQLREIDYFKESISAYRENFLRNYENGITVCAGTDIVFPEWHITPIAEELETLCMLGLTPMQAIRCATQNAARVLEAEKEFGTIREGLCADLLLVEGDPTQDIKALKKVREVYRKGELLHSSAG